MDKVAPDGFTIQEVTDDASPLNSIKVPEGAGTFAGMTLGEVLEDICHVSMGDRWWSHQHAATFSTAGLNNALSSLHRRLTRMMKDPPTTFIGWLKKNHTVTNFTHFVRRGGQPPICETSIGAGDEAVNKWRTAPPLPEEILKYVKREGTKAVQPWLEITSDVCNGNKVQIEQLLDWSAFVVMEPGKKPGYSIVAYSAEQGIGKDTFVEGLARALGAGNSTTIGRKTLERDFNTHIEKRLVHVSDLNTTTRGTTNGSDIYNLLKQPTSNLPRTIQVNQKHEPVYDADNLCAWVISTNDEAPMAIPAEDRRWYVVEGRDTKRDAKFYEETNYWIGTREVGDLIRAFLEIRWEGMSQERRAAIQGIAPETEAKSQMIDAGMTPVMTAIKERLTGSDCPDLIALKDILDHLHNLKQQDRLARNAPLPNPTQLGIWMRTKFRVPQVPVGKKSGKPIPARLPDKSDLKVYAVRRAAIYAQLTVIEVGKLYDEHAAKARIRVKY